MRIHIVKVNKPLNPVRLVGPFIFGIIIMKPTFGGSHRGCIGV